MLLRLQTTGAGGGLSALLGAGLQFALQDTFFWLFWVLLAANIADWIAGRFRARNSTPCTFDRKKSRLGLYEKSIALVVVLLVRSLEAILQVVVGITTGGWAASAITAALIYEDIESLDRHRMAMGKKSIPLLSNALAKMREITGGDRRLGRRNNDASQ